MGAERRFATVIQVRLKVSMALKIVATIPMMILSARARG